MNKPNLIEYDAAENIFDLCERAETVYRIFGMVYILDCPSFMRAIIVGHICSRFAISIEQANATVK